MAKSGAESALDLRWTALVLTSSSLMAERSRISPQSFPQTASDMVKHSARPYASIFHARTLRTSAVSRRTAAAVLSGASLVAGACRVAHRSRARRSGSRSHRRRMEAVARTRHRRGSVSRCRGDCRETRSAAMTAVSILSIRRCSTLFPPRRCWPGRMTSPATQPPTGAGFPGFRFSPVDFFWAHRCGMWRGGCAATPGGFIALTFYCFSPSLIQASAVWHTEPEIVAAWGAFGTIFTAIAVAHTLYAPREVVLWNWRRIVLLGISLAIAVGSQFSLIVLVPMALGFLLYVAPVRRQAGFGHLDRGMRRGIHSAVRDVLLSCARVRREHAARRVLGSDLARIHRARSLQACCGADCARLSRARRWGFRSRW